jgi:hypothetical protein
MPFQASRSQNGEQQPERYPPIQQVSDLTSGATERPTATATAPLIADDISRFYHGSRFALGSKIDADALRRAVRSQIRTLA